MFRSLFFSERQYGIEWRRPHELVEEPSLMEGGGDRFDINQVNEMTHISTLDNTYRVTIKERYNVGLNCDLILNLGEFLSLLGAHYMCSI